MNSKPKTRTIPHEEFHALYTRIKECPCLHPSWGFYDTSVWMLDDEFQPTQNMASIRWIMSDSVSNCLIFKVDGPGDAIRLIRGN